MLAIATGHVGILAVAFIIYVVVSARRISAERRLDALVQISRIAGDAVGSEEIRHALGADADSQRFSRWPKCIRQPDSCHLLARSNLNLCPLSSKATAVRSLQR